MFLNLFDLAIRNPFNKKARAEHDAKPESSFFDQQSHSFAYYSKRIEKENKVTPFQIKRLLEALLAEMNKNDYPSKFKMDIIDFVYTLGCDSRLFPDIDTVDIWYTDYYDLIQCSEKLGVGDPRLPHWPEEPNVNYRYLELSKDELVSMFLNIMNAILDKEETNSFSSISIDWDNEIKKFTNKPTEIKQNNNLPSLDLK